MFGYLELLRESREIRLGKSNLRVGRIGRSFFGRDILLFYPPKRPVAVLVGAFHGREHISGKLVSTLAKKYGGDRVAFIPILNPDGVELAIRGKDTAPPCFREKYIDWNGGNPDLSLWKANGRGVDLNVNFPADWGKGAKNIFYPHSENYVGESPFSERENLALRDYIARVNPYCVVAFHSKGEIIYYGYGNFEDRAENLEKLTFSTTYPCEIAKNSCGGFKDWFIKISSRPGYTVEVGDDRLSHPIPYGEFEKIYLQNKDIPYIAEEIGIKTKEREGENFPDWYKL